MTQELLQLLPKSLFDLSADGDNAKFWKIFSDQMDEVDSVFEDLRTVRDVESQNGAVLDLIGELCWESRDGKIDDTYRIYLIIAIQKMLCSGSEPDISAVFVALLGDDFIGTRDLYPESLDMGGLDFYLDGTYYLDAEYYLNGSIRKPAFFDIAIKTTTSDNLKTLAAKIIPHLRGAGIACKITELEA